jgi:hypothetical protein
MDKVQTVAIVSVNFSHALFSLLSTHGDLVIQTVFGYAWFGSEGFSFTLLGFVHHAN